MSDPIQGPTGQTGNGDQNQPPAQVPPAAHSAAQPPGTPPPATPPAASVNPADVQRLQQELDAAKRSASYFQSQFDQTRLALANVVGAAPPPANQPDPLAHFVEKLVAKGYAPKAARDTAELMHEMVQPIIRDVQATQQQTRQMAGIDSAIQEAYSAMPSLFTDPAAVAQVRQQCQTWVAQGGTITPRFALSIANDLALDSRLRSQQPGYTPPSPPQQQPQIFQNGMFNTQPAFTPPAATPTTQVSAASDHVTNEMATYLKLRKGGA